MTPHEKTPELAGYPGRHFKGGETQKHNNLILFPLHYRRNLLTLSERCRTWRMVRCPRGNYRTPMPEDLREVR